MTAIEVDPDRVAYDTRNAAIAAGHDAGETIAALCRTHRLSRGRVVDILRLGGRHQLPPATTLTDGEERIVPSPPVRGTAEWVEWCRLDALDELATIRGDLMDSLPCVGRDSGCRGFVE